MSDRIPPIATPETRLVEAAAGLATLAGMDERCAFFAGRGHPRYWWHQRTGNTYVPDVYRLLSESEWQILREWFLDTEEKEMAGECSIPAISWLTSYLSGNSISRVVQLGTYAGYSTLLLGWTLRRMGKPHSLLAVDNNEGITAYTDTWLTRAGLHEIVHQHVGDSAAPDLPALAREYFGAPPQLVFVDSSHQYDHTLRELDLWYAALPPGATMVLHDVSTFAAAFDPSGRGGVSRALAEWGPAHPNCSFALEYPQQSLGSLPPSYMDPCGLGLVIKQA